MPKIKRRYHARFCYTLEQGFSKDINYLPAKILQEIYFRLNNILLIEPL